MTESETPPPDGSQQATARRFAFGHDGLPQERDWLLSVP
jgi:hypothetical protein